MVSPAIDASSTEACRIVGESTAVDASVPSKGLDVVAASTDVTGVTSVGRDGDAVDDDPSEHATTSVSTRPVPDPVDQRLPRTTRLPRMAPTYRGES